MPNISRSHVFAFTLFGVPTLDELIDELDAARQVMGGDSKCKIDAHNGDQRDGYSMSVSISRPPPLKL
jgi:hypothetical protein